MMTKITSEYNRLKPLITNQTRDKRTQKTRSIGSLDITTKWLVVRYKVAGGLVLYPQSNTGLTNALTAASAGDLVKFYGEISGSVTVPADVELRGDGTITSDLSGTVTNNGILSGCYVSGTLTNNASLDGVVDTSGNYLTIAANIITAAQYVQINGGNRRKIAAKTANYTITLSDWTVFGDTALSDFTFTLPTAASAFDGDYDAGNIYNLKNTGTGTLTIDGNGSEEIDGETTVELIQDETITIQSDGSDWWIL